MAAEIKKTPWRGVEEGLIVEVPNPIVRLMTDRALARRQTSVKIIALGSRRFQIDQRGADGIGLRKIVLELLPDDRSKARVSGYQVLLVHEGEEWKPESVQNAFNAIAQAVIVC